MHELLPVVYTRLAALRIDLTRANKETNEAMVNEPRGRKYSLESALIHVLSALLEEAPGVAEFTILMHAETPTLKQVNKAVTARY